MQQLSATSGAHQQRLATNHRNGSRTPAAPSRGHHRRRAPACAQSSGQPVMKRRPSSWPPIAQSSGHLACVARPARDIRSSIARPARDGVARPARDGVARAVARARRGNRQSGPRPEPRLLRQAALEALTNSARTDSPRRIGRNEFRRLEAAAAAACVWRGGRRLALDDIQLEDDSAPDQFISTSSATTISASIAALRESFSNLVDNQSRDSRKMNNALNEVMCKIDHVQRVFLDSLAEQNETFRGLFKRSHQEALSITLKAIRTQNVILSTDLEATRKEVKDIKATLSKDFDDKLVDIRNELLEFHVDTQGQLASLSTHLAEIIAFLTKGSDDKRGKIVAATAHSLLLTIKADPAGEVVAVEIEQMNRAVLLEVVLGKAVEEVEVREEETVVVPQKEGDQVVSHPFVA
ncbi:DEAD-box ATP-dependent RNA helicase 20-like [Dorcoceras hygrometricum]|uniref:DEAD-box ATP-dependent RNA helicase 20-like n=1 Tax=Dorcoceras hygrometricum TaxID=472368 RepID=A0A2Z7CF25_9LAMI|nr:DEAD-box ATP-dependent RNA helicase 20-like [Dorcoceras hygrometricum]